MAQVTVVLVAAGKGERLGQNIPKALVPVAGESLLAHCLRRIDSVSQLVRVIVAAPAEHVSEVFEIADSLVTQADLHIVAGGASRQESIYNCLQLWSQLELTQDEIVLVHDTARAFTPTQVFDRVAQAVAEGSAGAQVGIVPVLPVVDTIKRATGTDILETIDRNHLRVAQTPQGFYGSALWQAYQTADAEHTDDAALFQAHGGSISSVLGHPDGFKVTNPDDLPAAARLLAASTQLTAPEQRSGIGTDVHRFNAAGSGVLRLAGIDWPGVPALEGHSDGDAVAHAIVDALLSAAALGDIGTHFGVDRPEYEGASGQVFVAATLELLAQAGWHVENVAVQVIGNRPKLAPQRELAQRTLTEWLGAPVSIGATTTDGLGFLGNSEGVAAVATALISRTPKVG